MGMWKTALVAAALVGAAAPASAATIFSSTTATPSIGSGEDITFTFSSAAVLADIDLIIRAFGSVNGVLPSNTDTLIARLNGNTLFSGNFPLGGGGTTDITSQVPGSTITTEAFGRTGGRLTFAGQSLLEGTNTLTVSFQATAASERISVESLNVSAAVPEPATWAMLLLGFFAIGGVLRSRNTRQTVTSVSYA